MLLSLDYWTSTVEAAVTVEGKDWWQITGKVVIVHITALFATVHCSVH